jgi:predicted MPP superfamily phosphohydrolase
MPDVLTRNTGKQLVGWSWISFGAIGLVSVATILVGYRNAAAVPNVRRLQVEVPDYPRGATPVRLVLLSDIHVHGPDMPPSRVATIVAQVNALHPDIVVLAGDFIGNNWVGRNYPLAEAIGPLARLKAKFGSYAVLGNNDYRAGGRSVAKTLSRLGVRVLNNEAVSVGPLALGGLDDRALQTPHRVASSEQKTFAALRRTGGAKVLLAHGPDQFPAVPDEIPLMLVGHTHCGQIALPFFGALLTGSGYGRRYACGLYRDGSRALVVTAGVGTSRLPLRYGAPPDIWFIEVKGD